jgi:DNA-binding CsgD family transcriptional regulator
MCASAPLSSALVGRDHELSILRERLAAAIGGHGSLVLIGGEAGIGKTTLAEILCHEATVRGALMLAGRCYDLSETPPYGPWADLFGRYQQGNGPPLPDGFARPGAVGVVTSQGTFFQAVQDFFATLVVSHTGGVLPLVLHIEDLHWADPASLDLLRAIARPLSTLPLLLLATYRADELPPAHPLARLLPAIVRESPVTRLDLRPLRADDVAALVAGRYHLTDEGTARLAAYAHRRSEGNPLFLGELLRTLEEEEVVQRTSAGWTLGFLTNVRVPPLLRQIIEGRAARLDEEARQRLAIAAVLGHEAPLPLWAGVAAVTEDALLPTIAQATAARLAEATEDGVGIRFVHALIREALYEGMSPPTRRRVHRAAAEALAGGRDPDPDAVASHFRRAGDERALPWLLRAGERAQRAYAWATAAARFEAALALMEREDSDAGERGWLLLRLSGLLGYVDVAKARAAADEAVTLATVANDGALAAFARLQRGSLDCHAGDVADGLPEMEAGATALEALSDVERAHLATYAAAIDAPTLLPEGRGTVVLWRATVGRYREARELGERLRADLAAGAETIPPGVGGGYFGLADAYAALGMPGEAAVMYARARDAYELAGHHFLAAIMSSREMEAVALPYRAEDIAGRRRLAERAAAQWARAGDAIPATLPQRFTLLPLLVLEGQWEEAGRLASAGGAEEQGDPAFRAFALRYLATLARLRGDAEGAWRAVRAALPAGGATEPGTVAYVDWAMAVQRVTIALALDERNLPAAKQWLVAHDRWLAWSGAVCGRSEGQALRARYQRQSGDIEQARAHAERALAHATEPRQPLALLAAHRLLGELDGDQRHHEDAAHHLEASLKLAEACQAPYERALTLLALAELRAASGDAAAGSGLDAVRAICEPLGARPALARADALAARIAAMKGTPPASPAGLSTREIEVLRLLADGHTNREIADALFLSVHTVSAHIRTILAKTNADNRTAAAAFARRHDLA